jgi:hypothetical protein
MNKIGAYEPGCDKVARFPSRKLLITPPRVRWGDEAKARLQELVRLEPGWDGYGALPVTLENAFFALEILNFTCGPGVSAPSIVPGPGGDLQLEWHTRACDIEVHIQAPYEVCAWRRLTDGDPIGEEVSLTNDFFKLSQWLNTLTEQSNAAISTAA